MLKRIFILFIVAGVSFILSSLAGAGPVPLFGPQTFERTTGKPDTYTATIEACNTGAAYSLVVENGEGGAGGKDRISSASVTLNNEALVKQKDFNQRVDRVERAVTLLPENTLEVKLASGPTGFITVSINCVANCLGVSIGSPDSGSTVNKSSVIMRGSLQNTYGETGVTITSEGDEGALQGLAQVQGTDFAGISFLQLGENTLIATATDACGYRAQDSLTLNAEPAEEPVRLTAIPSSGVPSITTGTLDVSFEAEAYLENISNYSWDFDGDGTPERQGSDLAEITAGYGQPGLYFPEVTVTDSEGNAYTETTLVNVLSIEEMNAVIKGKWDGMRNELISEDVEKAVGFFDERVQEKYREQLTVMLPLLSIIANDMREIRIVEVGDDWAKYEILTEREGKIYSQPLIFMMDKDGLWKIGQF